MNKPEKILLYGANLWYLGEGMLGPLLAIFTQHIGGSVLDLTWAWSTYLVIMGIFMIVFGNVSDSLISKEKMMVAGYALNAIFTFSYIFVDSTIHLFLVQAGLGLASAMATPTWDALYAKHENKKRDGTIWGLATGQASLITGIAIVIGGYIVNYFSFTTLFLLMGTIQVIATIYQAQILKK